MYKHLGTVLGTAIMVAACSAAQAQMVGTPSGSVSAGVRGPGTASATSSYSKNRQRSSSATQMPSLESKPILHKGHVVHSQSLNRSSTASNLVQKDQASTTKPVVVMPTITYPKISPMGMGIVMPSGPAPALGPYSRFHAAPAHTSSPSPVPTKRQISIPAAAQ